MTWKRTIIAIIIVMVIGVFLAVNLIKENDIWICEDGQWVRYGTPWAPMPDKPCE